MAELQRFHRHLRKWRLQPEDHLRARRIPRPNLHSENGRAQGAAPVPLVNGAWGGQVYGRYTVRFKSDALPGYGTGWLLWPDSNNWNDGEIDFPESGLNSTIKGYNHTVGNPAHNDLVFDTGVTYLGWHTATIEWTPSKITYLLDGNVVSSSTTSVPSKALHWVLQTATTGTQPDRKPQRTPPDRLGVDLHGRLTTTAPHNRPAHQR